MVVVHSLQCSSPHIPLLLPLFFLILTSSMEVAASSDAGRLAAEMGASKQIKIPTTIQAGRRRALIGSRPPRCERVCLSCGHCEAVQVPIVPQEDHHHRLIQKRSAATTTTTSLFAYRVDGIANYKPLSWKCMCGGTIMDP